VRAESVSLGVADLLQGPLRRGVGLGAGYLDFGGWVLALTRPGKPRMPNGVECELVVARGQPAWIGEGRLEAGGRTVLAGAAWDPRPRPRFRLEADRRFTPDPLALGGRGGGLTPSGDDVLAGYAAGLVLWHGLAGEAARIAAVAAPLTTRLSATLLQHAALGHLPEPAHRLLEDGDLEPLLRFGHSSGRALLLGLALAC
jgi:hypothetical protein